MSDLTIFLTVLLLCSTVMFMYFWSHGGPIFIRALSASWRMGLRDKGPNPRWLCPACDTELRVGITEGGEAVDYCWRCEAIPDDIDDPDPDDEEDIPTETEMPEKGFGAKILPFDKSDRKTGGRRL